MTARTRPAAEVADVTGHVVSGFLKCAQHQVGA